MWVISFHIETDILILVEWLVPNAKCGCVANCCHCATRRRASLTNNVMPSVRLNGDEANERTKRSGKEVSTEIVESVWRPAQSSMSLNYTWCYCYYYNDTSSYLLPTDRPTGQPTDRLTLEIAFVQFIEWTFFFASVVSRSTSYPTFEFIFRFGFFLVRLFASESEHRKVVSCWERQADRQNQMAINKCAFAKLINTSATHTHTHHTRTHQVPFGSRKYFHFVHSLPTAAHISCVSSACECRAHATWCHSSWFTWNESDSESRTIGCFSLLLLLPVFSPLFTIGTWYMSMFTCCRFDTR